MDVMRKLGNSPLPDPTPPPDVGAVLAMARTLRRAAEMGATRPLLRGKNLGLMCESAEQAEAAFFRRAAVELGAQVAHIRPSLSGGSPAHEVQRTARLLGRLYDAVECQDMASSLVRRIGDEAGVPVYDCISSQLHPTAQLAALLGGETSAVDNRRFVLQAILLCTLS